MEERPEKRKVIDGETGNERNEEYWERYFIQPWDMDGKSTAPQMEMIKNIGEGIQETHPCLVGVLVVGSTLKGYSENLRSDADIQLVVDGTEEDLAALEKEADEKADSLGEFYGSEKFEGGRRVHVVRHIVFLPRIRKNIKSGELFDDIEDVAALFYSGFGPLAEIRGEIRTWADTLSEDRKENWLERIISSVDYSTMKMFERGFVKESDRHRFEELLRQRIENRVRMFFDPDYKQWKAAQSEEE